MKPIFKAYFLAIFAIGVIVTSCSEGGADPEPSMDNSLRNFEFSSGTNSQLSSNCMSVSNGDLIYITVPEKDSLSLSSLVPTFSVHEKATVMTPGGAPIQSGVTSFDFTKPVKIAVTSETGYTKTYTVLAKAGNPAIDSKIYDFMNKHSVPGLSIAISKDEEIVYSYGYGYANKEKEERTTKHHLFRLASMSKQHAAIAIMHLYEKGLLDIDAPVFGENGILKQFGNSMTLDWKNVTVKHLLSHTSGITTEIMFPPESGYSGKDATGRIELLLKQGKIPYAPGTTYEYNNTNFVIIGKIVETVSGKNYVDFLKEDIYTPIGIEDIYGGQNSGPINNEVKHYSQNSVNPYDNNVEIGVAAGGIVASAPALMKLMAHIDYKDKVPDIFRKETLDLMYTPLEGIVDTDKDPWSRYALGWRVNYPYIDNWTTYHGGTLAGVCPVWARGTDNINGVILCNSRSYSMSIDDDLWEMLSAIQKMFK